MKECLDMLPVHRKLVRNTILIYKKLAVKCFNTMCQYGRSLAYVSLALNNQGTTSFV